MRIRLIAVLVVSMLLSVISIACSSTKETIQYEGDAKMTATLKVMTYADKSYFMKEYGDLFQSKYPNIEIEVVNYNSANFEKVVKEQKPDLLLISIDEYAQLIEENRLVDLSTLFANDDYNLEGIHSEIINVHRQIGKGKLYGLQSEFLTKAIFYNKDLFDKYNVPYPQDQMTWNELFQLAKRFPTGDGVSGLYIRNFVTLADDIALSKHLSKVDTKNVKVTINTESYKEIFEMILDVYESKAVTLPDIDLFEVYDPFITGTSAMTVDYYYYIHNNINWAKEEKGIMLNWELASAPVDEASRDISPYFTLGGATAINVESDQKQAAWEFLKFQHSEEFAKAKSRTTRFFMSTRTGTIYNPEGKRMEAFYNLKPDTNFTRMNYDLLPKGFLRNLEGVVGSEAKAAMVGVKTLDEAMVSMQERGQQLLDQK
ncbi:Bacterial extracellular solute-binding protein [compost metagenome]